MEELSNAVGELLAGVDSPVGQAPGLTQRLEDRSATPADASFTDYPICCT
ncbi:hypothetical protein A8924_4777 [Saccharopolyspora erythraea NRRL 2338]|uniref:Uncharacterized protein n=2 Tax=Saccharopolyspora erythraea TaxID=1836 RepID=A4FHY4_SACEN|nr:hypothetical protein [Saccharopolyspora erythraea]EQD85085.1 hypothetical protein N599_16855 [Saccharopolyspora erythraea D]PFG97344.1 hypothetical protein A8924_4777 [Saccharopolyspora erythraea NRRL 2338]QRK87531.1 hypothetical protein JQX30_22360 [Saccharopolyspora erythraea]CAM03659.1 hypothetical protein SACE_4390 [Saccharopolyspora erythraea NRRL 2338]